MDSLSEGHWWLNTELLDGDITWQPAADLPPLVIDLQAMFAELWGDH